MGVVYAAHDDALQREVAIKLLRPDLGRSSAALLREARAAARVTHPNVCTIYEVGEHEGTPFLVMELLDGETVAARLARGPLGPFEACGILVPALEADARRSTTHDFGKDIVPALVDKALVAAYRFYDENKKSSKYWRDIGTLDAYYDANMDLCHVNPEFNLYDPEWPLRTYQVQAPPAKFVFADRDRRCGQALDSIISAGCIISGSRVSGSVLCPNVRVHSFCEVDQSILMPGVRVGRHARIRRAIIDRDVFIPRAALIGYNEEEDRRRHTVTQSGIVVVTTDDQPLIGEVPEAALETEAEFDRRGSI